MDEDIQYLSGHGEPRRRLPSLKYLEGAMYAWAPFGGSEDPDGRGSGGVRPRDNLQPQLPTQGPAEMRRKKYLRRHSFPRKLWKTLEDDNFTSVRWSDNGDSVIIDQDLFQREVLRQKGAKRGSSWLSSFTRRLSLYGFKKIHTSDASGYLSENNRILMYRNSNFRKDKPWLMENMMRQDNQMTLIGAATPERGEPAAPGIHSKDTTEAANQMAQERTPVAQGPNATGSFQLMGLGSPSHAVGVHVPNELARPSRQGTSGNGVFGPIHTAMINNTGEGPSSAPDHPSGDSLIFYSTSNNPSALLPFPSWSHPSALSSTLTRRSRKAPQSSTVLSEQYRDNVGP
ncbi:heat shock transcription factor, X-linked member 3-like [Saccopteryx leptura]|uniref:heat shock transcription factor, X-linked member 3-like n=1 Tax=Saccopteryx leptura TaxID=249018 RepID=UPI00339BC1EF